MAGADARQRAAVLVARYTDPAGRAHRIVLRRSLVLDVCGCEPPVVVAELSAEEGIDQARAVVFGGDCDPGYLERARAGEGRLGRRLRAEELRLPEATPPEPGIDQDDERRRAA